MIYDPGIYKRIEPISPKIPTYHRNHGVPLGNSCISEKGLESALCASGLPVAADEGEGLPFAEALIIAASIMAVNPPESGLVLSGRLKGPSVGKTALIAPKLISDG